MALLTSAFTMSWIWVLIVASSALSKDFTATAMRCMSSLHIVNGPVTTNVGVSFFSVLLYSGVDVFVGIAGGWSEIEPSLDFLALEQPHWTTLKYQLKVLQNLFYLSLYHTFWQKILGTILNDIFSALWRSIVEWSMVTKKNCVNSRWAHITNTKTLVSHSQQFGPCQCTNCTILCYSHGINRK